MQSLLLRLAFLCEMQDSCFTLSQLLLHQSVLCSVSLKANNTQHSHTHHATQHVGSRNITPAHRNTTVGIGQRAIRRHVCLEELEYVTHAILMHCFELWHVLTVTLTSLISVLDSGSVFSTLSTWEERKS